MRMLRTAVAAAALALAPVLGFAEEVTPRHGIAMHGDPKYGPDFTHFDYVNPDAPQGGTVRLSAIGTYDTLNPYTLRGVAGAGLGYLFESLMVGAQDEAFTEYGLIAESVEMPEDRSWVAFNLRPEARFHDGKPITAEDVIWSFETLKSKGEPFYRAYYANVAKAEVLGGFGWFEGEGREEGAARGIPAGDHLQLFEVGEARLHPVVALPQDVVVEGADARDVHGHRGALVGGGLQTLEQHA